MPDPRITRDQQRAQAAYQRVKNAKELGTGAKDYKSQCLHLPTLIHQCGLCQAVAFLEAKAGGGKKHSNQLLADLAAVMGAGEGLADKARTAPVHDYQRMTIESLACAQWLKRYAEALLE